MVKKHIFLLISVLICAVLNPVKVLAKTDLTRITLNCNAAQETLKLNGFRREDGAIYITASEENLGNLCVQLGGTVNYSSKCLQITKDTISTPIETDGSGDSIIFADKECKHTLIRFEKLADLLKGKLTYDSSRDTYTISPTISQITAEDLNNELTLNIQATSNIRYNTEKLQSPEGIIITIDDAYLAPGLELPANPLLQGIIIKQNEKKPGSVSITIPHDGTRIAEVQPRILPQQVVIKIKKQEEAVSGSSDSIVRLTNIDVVDSKNYIKITVTTSRPFDFQWRRLRAPDNRFFIDFLNTTLEAPCTSFEPNNCLVEKVRAAQLQPGDDGIARLVLDLTHPAECEIRTSNNNPEQMTVIVKNQLIDIETAFYTGNGSTVQQVYATNGCGQIVCIDPGHGGSDRGAYNRNLGLAEKDVTLDIALRLAKILKERGFSPVLTRMTDRDVTYAGSPDKEELAARTRVAEQNNSLLFVSIHINASVNKNANGISTHWYKADDKNLAQEIQYQLIQKTGRLNRGISRDRFFVLRNTDLPSVLVEAGFISNDEEASMLLNEEYLQRIAEAVADGLGSYIANRMPGKVTTTRGGMYKK